jgi:hypothetical protein
MTISGSSNILQGSWVSSDMQHIWNITFLCPLIAEIKDVGILIFLKSSLIVIH